MTRKINDAVIVKFAYGLEQARVESITLDGRGVVTLYGTKKVEPSPNDWPTVGHYEEVPTKNWFLGTKYKWKFTSNESKQE